MAEHLHDDQDLACRDFVEIATEYLERALPEERHQLVEEHLVLCDDCVTYLDQLQTTVEALPNAVVDEPVSDDTRETLLTMFRTWQNDR